MSGTPRITGLSTDCTLSGDIPPHPVESPRDSYSNQIGVLEKGSVENASQTQTLHTDIPRGGSAKPFFESVCIESDRYLPKLEMNSAKCWTELSNKLQSIDDKQSQSNNENIDTLLVFASLFSAILAAFAIEAYKLLQRDSAETSVQILIQISQQLNSFSLNTGFINSTHTPGLPPPFVPNSSSLWVNALWFTALIFSLVTVSLGMLVKQWLREYQSNPPISSEEHRRVRLFRVRGLRKYRVLEIATFLPLLLQTALALFFAGLVLFVLGVHPYIGWIVLGLVATWSLFVLVTTVIPIFSPSCPYKTPFLKGCFFRFRQLLSLLYWRATSISSRKTESTVQCNGPERSVFVEEADVAQQEELDHEVQLDAYEAFPDIKIWEIITCCIDLDTPRDALAKLLTIVKKKSGIPIDVSSDISTFFRKEERRLLSQSMIACVRRRFLLAASGKCDLDNIDLRALYTLNKFWHTLGDRLDSMLCALFGEAFSLPWSYESLSRLILWKLGFRDARLPAAIGPESMYTVSLVSGSLVNVIAIDPRRSRPPNRNIIELCRIILLCVLRSGNRSQSMKDPFSSLMSSIANILTTSPASCDLQLADSEEVFRCHCALDIAMRICGMVPGTVPRTLLGALHAHSVRMFNQASQQYWWYEGRIQGEREVASATAVKQYGNADWEEVLGGKGYAAVEMRNHGDYGDQWEYHKLQVSCKYRIEFMLNYECFDGKRFREVLRESQLVL